MAKASDLPQRHRGYAERLDPELLGALSPAELRHRAAYAAELEDSAAGMSPEISGLTAERASQALTSEPVWAFIQRQRKLNALIGEARSFEVASAYATARREHEEANVYPPGLREAVEGHYDGRRHPELSPLAEEIVAHHDR